MPTTELLIRQVQRGCSIAREELYRRYAMRVMFLVRARMGPALRLKEQSGDMAQEALLKSLRGLDGFCYHAEGAFIGFLAKKVEEVLRDRVDYWKAAKRDPKRDRPLDETGASGSIAQISPGRVGQVTIPSKILERHEDIRLLARALDRLREENRTYWELILAVDLEGRCLADLAEEQGRSVGAIRKRHGRAKDVLTQIFSKLAALDSRKDVQDNGRRRAVTTGV